MLASWMAYASIVSLAFAGAAVALERLAAAKRWPLRWIWAGALIASIGWPITTALWPARQATVSSDVALPLTIVVGPTISVAADDDTPSTAVTTDGVLVTAWGALSALMLLRLSHSLMALRRRRRLWRRLLLDGDDVYVSANDGPAVVGVGTMHVVVPEWVLALDATRRAMILRHEHEHRAARDPYLLLAAAVLVAALPWNPALWLLGRRLRLAIEIDCDARVLRAHPSAERYGLLLLAVAERRLSAPVQFAAMLSEPTTHLEKRIIAMQSTRSIARRTAAGMAATAIAFVAFACTLRSAEKPAASQVGATPAQQRNDSALAAFMNAQGFKSWTAARPALGNVPPLYPAELRGKHVEGAVLVSVVIDTSGVPDMRQFRVLTSTDDAFSTSVRTALPGMRFIAAEANGAKVKALIQVPFLFVLGGGEGRDGPARGLSAGLDTAYRTTQCQAGACPVLRLANIVSTAAP